jgi:uracil-DNA glycosylase
VSEAPEVDEPSPREELRDIALALRTYVEWHEDTGTTGFPREPRPLRAATVDEEAPAPPELPPVSVPPHVPALAIDQDALERALRAPDTTAAAPEPAPPPASRAPRPLDVVAEEVAVCTRCGLAQARTHAVFARGNPGAALCFIGEAPDEDDDRHGEPFAGAAGQLLDRMIVAMGLDPRADVYVCHLVKCHPAGRRPGADEVAACLPFLEEQLAAVSPRVVVALGQNAAAALLGSTLGLATLRGHWKLYRGRMLMATHHPAELLAVGPQQRKAKADAWSDLQQVMKELGLPGR